jgi:hypothetical protein
MRKVGLMKHRNGSDCFTYTYRWLCDNRRVIILWHVIVQPILSNGSKLGNSSYSGYTVLYLKPIDEFKGDFGDYFTGKRYEDKISSGRQNSSTAAAILAGNSYPAFKDWYVFFLLEWESY